MMPGGLGIDAKRQVSFVFGAIDRRIGGRIHGIHPGRRDRVSERSVRVAQDRVRFGRRR